MSFFGNGNYNVADLLADPLAAANIRNASKNCGYRIVLTGGSLSTVINNGLPLSVTLNWRNTGVAPVFENWQIKYELQNQSGGAVAWTGNSSFQLKFFLPNASSTANTDNFTLPGTIPAGTYRLVVKITDPNGYRSPFPIAITGRQSDGSYILRSNIVITAGGNQVPVVNAGGDQSISIADTYDLILIFGDSNAGGQGANADATSAELSARTNTKILNNNTLLFENLDVGYNNHIQQNQDGTGLHGIELGLANEIDSVSYPYKKPAYIVKCGVSGADTKEYIPYGGAGYFATLITRMDAAVSILNQEGKNYRVTVMGTMLLNDLYNCPTCTEADSKSNLITIMSEIRSLYDPNAIFIWQNLFDGFNWNNVFDELAAADPLVFVTDITGATYIDGNSHYDYAGLKLIASRNVANMVANHYATAVLTATVSDSDGSIVSQSWSKVSGPAGDTIESVNSTTTNVRGLVEGTYVYRFTATDNSGGITSDTVSIQVYTSSPISFNEIPYGNVEFLGPGRGGESWNDQNIVDIPVEGSPQTSLDSYHRDLFSWAALEATKGVYDFSLIQQKINSCITLGQKFSFGIITVHVSNDISPTPIADGVKMNYPLWLHNEMQAEPVKDANIACVDEAINWWLPNYNSNIYLTRLELLYTALASWLNSTSYLGVTYRDVVGYIDIRGFGNKGGWSHYPFFNNLGLKDGNGDFIDGVAGTWPIGMRPTLDTLKRIVNVHTSSFSNYQLVQAIPAFDAEYFWNTYNPPDIAKYVLEIEYGGGKKIGWRNDNWGDNGTYVSDYLENNSRGTLDGQPFSYHIMERYKYAPIVGEPTSFADSTTFNGCYYGNFEYQVGFYHALSFGNGNFYGTLVNCIKNNWRAASKKSGYRIKITGGEAPSNVKVGNTLRISLSWQNVGASPTYENWVTNFEIQNRTSNAVLWTGSSSHTMKLFLPSASSTTVVDNFIIPGSVALGTRRLVLKIIDPLGYRDPFPLAIEGRRADGSYTLIDSFVVS
jgi:hypothetical protein